ncbi:MAG: hypothetical protein K9J37_19820 [Saprospiraceae bacterium]|nr:hypothetical protein [Saprospiraceae bacterium]MCF8252175.1 hypothetical protein [Saprospiraceae bacterium]MCF8281572.1 hypothetical protein [Bacteroidales bacterium]MCF8313844.1 hypothetical protein [Saprospiraceae bacterium]MCF8442564.1 hypothetical protein [Saprospiraceae bacterium]
MSEFQCYKFKTIDRPLTESERREVDGLSSHGQVNNTSAIFTYQYGNFKHKPETVLVKYFDAMLYYSNWGTRRLMFRLPAKLVDEKAIKPYLYGEEYYCHIDLLKRGGRSQGCSGKNLN